MLLPSESRQASSPSSDGLLEIERAVSKMKDALGLQLYDSHYNVRVTIKCRSVAAHHIQEGE